MKEHESVATDFFKRLLEKMCPHQFSWPHSGSQGQDYQVCLICGTAYEYDLVNMCRTGRVITPVKSDDSLAHRRA